MANIGKQTVKLTTPIYVTGTGTVVGPKEGEGPLKAYFDLIETDMMAGEETWEKAESKLSEMAMTMAVKKANTAMTQIDYLFAGDLLNQCMGSVMAAKDFKVPYFGIYGACSNMGLGMALGAMVLQGQFAKQVLVGASSHFCAAEKQFRFPLELGSQRPPTASTTVTGAGAAVLSVTGSGPVIKTLTTGKIVDLGITDPNNMGAAMAPAAAETLMAHFKDLDIAPTYYDLIVTGDLGHVGHELVKQMTAKAGFDLSHNYEDCGRLIYDQQTQDTHAGGSGCGCSAVTFGGYLYDQMMKKIFKKVLFVPTGALMSTTSVQQKCSIPGIAHAVGLEIE